MNVSQSEVQCEGSNADRLQNERVEVRPIGHVDRLEILYVPLGGTKGPTVLRKRLNSLTELFATAHDDYPTIL